MPIGPLIRVMAAGDKEHACPGSCTKSVCRKGVRSEYGSEWVWVWEEIGDRPDP